jgi:hypothetical protein
MAVNNVSVKGARLSTRKAAAEKSAALPPPIVAYDSDVTDAAVATLVRALLTVLRQSLSFAFVAASALRRRNFKLGADVAGDLTKALDDKLDIDLRELERLLTYVYRRDSGPRTH